MKKENSQSLIFGFQRNLVALVLIAFAVSMLSLLPFLATAGAQGGDGAARLSYPETKRTDHTDNYFGVTVADPYRWLEDDNSPECAHWVEAENKVTFAYLEKIPYRQQIKDRLTQLFNYPKY